MPKYCPECGKPLLGKAKFCSNCGADLESLFKTNLEKSQPNYYKNELEKTTDTPNMDFSTIQNKKLPWGLKKVEGNVSNLSKYHSTSGSVRTNSFNGLVSGYVRTNHWTTFRVNNCPCWWPGTLDISEGDIVSIAGEGSGEILVWALHNQTTNLVYWPRLSKGVQGYGTLSVYMGITSLVGFGLAFAFVTWDPPNFLGAFMFFAITLILLGIMTYNGIKIKIRNDAVSIVSQK